MTLLAGPPPGGHHAAAARWPGTGNSPPGCALILGILPARERVRFPPAALI